MSALKCQYIKYLAEWNGEQVVVLDEYYSNRDKCWYCFILVDYKAIMIDRSELNVTTKENL